MVNSLPPTLRTFVDGCVCDRVSSGCCRASSRPAASSKGRSCPGKARGRPGWLQVMDQGAGAHRAAVPQNNQVCRTADAGSQPLRRQQAVACPLESRKAAAHAAANCMRIVSVNALVQHTVSCCSECHTSTIVIDWAAAGSRARSSKQQYQRSGRRMTCAAVWLRLSPTGSWRRRQPVQQHRSGRSCCSKHHSNSTGHLWWSRCAYL